MLIYRTKKHMYKNAVLKYRSIGLFSSFINDWEILTRDLRFMKTLKKSNFNSETITFSWSNHYKSFHFVVWFNITAIGDLAWNGCVQIHTSWMLKVSAKCRIPRLFILLNCHLVRLVINTFKDNWTLNYYQRFQLLNSSFRETFINIRCYRVQIQI